MHPMTFEYYIDINSCSTIALQQLCGQIRLFFGINPVVSGEVAFGNIRWLEIQPCPERVLGVKGVRSEMCP